MKYLLFALLNLVWVSSYSQKISQSRTSILLNKPIPLSKGYYNTTSFSQVSLKNKNFSVFSGKSDEKREMSFQYDPFFASGLENKTLMLRAASLQGHLGNIKVSCSYLYDETGRLVDAVSSWNFGH